MYRLRRWENLLFKKTSRSTASANSLWQKNRFGSACRPSLFQKTAHWERSSIDSKDYIMTIDHILPVFNCFTDRLLLMHQAGFLDYAVRKSKLIRNPCSFKDKNTNEPSGEGAVALKFRDFQGAFLILGAGFCIAFFIFACECICKIFIRGRPRVLY